VITFNADNAEWKIVGEGVRRRITLVGEKLMFVEVHFQPGSIGSLHQHSHEQASYVLSGRIKFDCGDKTVVISAGESIRIPSNVLHGVEALEETVLLDVFSPPREDFLENQNGSFPY
jgi:quercetin dioxygenase-like cupin family protein